MIDQTESNPDAGQTPGDKVPADQAPSSVPGAAEAAAGNFHAPSAAGPDNPPAPTADRDARAPDAAQADETRGRDARDTGGRDARDTGGPDAGDTSHAVDAPVEEAGPPVVKASWAARIGRLIVGLAGLVLAVGGLCGAAAGVRGELRKATAYVPAAAAVTRYVAPSEYIDDHDQIRRHRGMIEYEFTIGGRTHAGSYIQTPLPPGADASFQALGRAMTKGEAIEVFYDPAEPLHNTPLPLPCAAVLAGVLALLPLYAAAVRLIVRAASGAPRRQTLAGTGGGSFLLAYAVLSGLAALAFMRFSIMLPWQKAFWLGGGLVAPIVPLASVLAGGFIRQCDRRLADQTAALLRDERHLRAMAFDYDASFHPRVTAAWWGQLALAIAFCGAVGAAAWAVGVPAWKSYLAGRQFLTTNATVVSSTVAAVTENTPQGARTRHEPVIKYHYLVNGKQYVSQRYVSDANALTNPDVAQAIVDRFQPDRPDAPGRTVTAYYDPAHPERAVLNPRLPPASPAAVMALEPPALLAAGLLLAVLAGPLRLWRVRRFLKGVIRLPWRITHWGTLRDEEDGMAIQGRGRPVLTAWLGFTVAAAVTLALVAADPSPRGFSFPLLGYTTAACLCAGAAGLAIGLRRRGGRMVLDIDQRLIKLSYGGHEETIGLDDLQCWTLQWVGGRTGRPDGLAPMAPVIGIRTVTQADHVLRQFPFGSPLGLYGQVARKAAEELAAITDKDLVLLEQ